MEKISLTKHSPVSIILANAFAEVSVGSGFDKIYKNVYDDGHEGIDCELKIGGHVIPIAYFFNNLCDSYNKDVEKKAALMLRELIHGKPILEKLEDMRERVSNMLSEISHDIEQYATDELGVKFDSDGYRHY
jgi:hypothetical protein